MNTLLHVNFSKNDGSWLHGTSMVCIPKLELGNEGNRY